MDDEGVERVGGHEEDQAAGGPEPRGDGPDAGGELAVRHRRVGREDRGAVAVGREVCGERDGPGAGEEERWCCHGRIVGKPYLIAQSQKHHR
ncbi:hypothetical protein GCM10010272_25380 [Streptomyces lateritius]|nr:hypothetical protein GCM10010272_25380 [Streptomyces lateritius]